MPNPNLPIGGQYNVYTGARYVPLIMGAWSETVAYEPLSIVTYQGNSYTSRTFVPAGVAPTNETYWAATGNYNAQVEQYRQEVASLNNTVSGIQSDIIDIQDDVTKIEASLQKQTYYVFMGDSYGNPLITNNWVSYACQMAGITNYANTCTDGASFGGATLYKSQLSSSEITDTPDHIILCGGYNDRNIASNTVITGIQNFMQAVKTKWPKCKVSIGYISIGGSVEEYSRCVDYGAECITGSWLLMRNYSNLGPDFIHPNENGQKVIGRGIANYLLGNTPFNTTPITTTITPEANITLTTSSMKWFLNNGSVDVSIELQLRGPFQVGGNSVLIGGVGLDRCQDNFVTDALVRAASGNEVETVSGVLTMANNTLTIACTLTLNNPSISIVCHKSFNY